MKKKNWMVSVPGFLLALAFLPGCKNEDSLLVGTWKLISDQQISTSGKVVNQDVNVDGQLTYTAFGKMSVQLIWFSPRDVMMYDSVMNFDGVSVGVGPGTNTWTCDENRLWVDTYDAYFGEYEIDTKLKVVTHKISGNLRPEQLGIVYKRLYTIRGDTLFLKSAAPTAHWQTVWLKM
ncbi:MAG: lipocalin-like domain-containing protein [Cyclobacteriaceae bacterium]|nr:lipocalin-like domain-containing protein [Cyclobacteriaceae bacterium]